MTEPKKAKQDWYKLDFDPVLHTTKADVSGTTVNLKSPIRYGDAKVRDKFKERYPLEWAACNIRMYKDVESYNSVSFPAMAFTHALAESIQPNMSHIAQTAYLAVVGLQHYNFPYLFVSSDLLEAAKHTTIDPSLKWEDVPLPFPFGTFMLPKGGLVHPELGEIQFLTWGCPVATHEYRFGKSYPTVTLEDGNLIIVWTALADDRTDRPFLFSATTTDTSFEEFEIKRKAPANLQLVDKWALATSEEESAFLARLRELVAAISLILAARPKLLSHGKKTGVHKKSNREIWTANIIGRDFKLKKESSKGNLMGHASPRVHWRRGHYRNQPYGTLRANIKRIWLEPVLVGGED